MLTVIQNLRTMYPFMIAFVAGSIVGLFTFSRFLKFLIKNHKSSTFAVLVGIMLGTLLRPGKMVVVQMDSLLLIIGGIVCLILGFGAVLLLEYFANKKGSTSKKKSNAL